MSNMRSLFLLCCLLGLVAGCQTDEDASSVARDTFEDLQQKYDELLKEKIDAPVDWAAADIENIGDWEYRVETLLFDSEQDLTEQLNEFGNDRWQVIWLERTPDGFLTVMKKPSVSYLSKIPLSTLGKMVIPGSEGTE